MSNGFMPRRFFRRRISYLGIPTPLGFKACSIPCMDSNIDVSVNNEATMERDSLIACMVTQEWTSLMHIQLQNIRGVRRV